MAGIKELEKRPANLDYIVNEMLRPELRYLMFDDCLGWAEIQAALYDLSTVVYGIFEKGHPVPIGTIILNGVRPYRGCQLHIAIFKKENRGQKKIQGLVAQLKHDLVVKWKLHHVEARILSTNAHAKHLVEKFGMKKIGTKPGSILCNGEYADVDEYYLILGDVIPN